MNKINVGIDHSQIQCHDCSVVMIFIRNVCPLPTGCSQWSLVCPVLHCSVDCCGHLVVGVQHQDEASRLTVVLNYYDIVVIIFLGIHHYNNYIIKIKSQD